MAVHTLQNKRVYGSSAPLDSRVIGADAPDAFTQQYGMSADSAYDQLMGKANMKMNLGATGGGADLASIEESLGAFNKFIGEQQNVEQEMISGSDFYKSQMAIAERKGATARTPAAAALGGGTMSTAPLASATTAIGSPPGVAEAAKFKAGQGGK